jgi:hypothetical protein
VAETVRVKGLRDLQRDLRKVSKGLSKELREGLLTAGRIVERDASGRLMPINASSASGLRTYARTRGVSVEQSRRRTTGQHPEFGALQMRRALLPALESKENEVVSRVEDVLDGLFDRHEL